MKKDGKESLFTIHDGVLLKYIGKEPDVVIPDEVTEIATNAIWRRKILSSAQYSAYKLKAVFPLSSLLNLMLRKQNMSHIAL